LAVATAQTYRSAQYNDPVAQQLVVDLFTTENAVQETHSSAQYIDPVAQQSVVDHFTTENAAQENLLMRIGLRILEVASMLW